MTSFILSAGNTHTHTHTLPGPPSPQASGSKRSLSQSTRSKSPVSRGGRRTPLTYIIDIINNGHLMRLHNNSGIHTQAYYRFPANILHHNLHLSRSHNGRLVISELPPTPVGLSAEASPVQWASYICREKQPVPNKTGTEREQCGHVGKAWAICGSSRDPTQ